MILRRTIGAAQVPNSGAFDRRMGSEARRRTTTVSPPLPMWARHQQEPRSRLGRPRPPNGPFRKDRSGWDAGPRPRPGRAGLSWVGRRASVVGVMGDGAVLGEIPGVTCRRRPCRNEARAGIRNLLPSRYARSAPPPGDVWPSSESRPPFTRQGSAAPCIPACPARIPNTYVASRSPGAAPETTARAPPGTLPRAPPARGRDRPEPQPIMVSRSRTRHDTTHRVHQPLRNGPYASDAVRRCRTAGPHRRDSPGWRWQRRAPGTLHRFGVRRLLEGPPGRAGSARDTGSTLR